MIELLTKLYKQKEELQSQADLIIYKYGNITNLLNSSVNAYPNKDIIIDNIKELNKWIEANVSKESIDDYNKWFNIQQEIMSISNKCHIIGMRAKGYTDQEIKELKNYKPNVILDEVINI
jgi:hypothetical protein